MSHRSLVALATMLAAVTLSLYSPSFSGPYIFDDFAMLGLDGQKVIQVGAADFLRPETRPVVRGTFALEQVLGLDHACSRRMVNVCIHLACGWLLYQVIVRLVAQSVNPQSRPDQAWIAAAVAVLWLLHPLQTSVVANIVQRCESLAVLFMLAYLLCVIYLAEGGNRIWGYLAVVAFVMGVYCKTTGVTIVPVGLLLDRTFYGSSWRIVLRRQWRVLALSSAGTILAIISLWPTLTTGAGNIGFVGEAPPIPLYLASQAKVLWLYLAQSVFAWNISIDHGLRPMLHWADGTGWLFATAGLLLMGVVFWIRRMHVTAFLILSPLIILSATSSVVPTADLWVDHRMYLPLAAVLTGVVILAGRVFTACGVDMRLCRLAFFLTVVFVSYRTCICAQRYQSGVQIWEAALQQNPDNDRAVQNLMDASRREGQDNSTIALLTDLLELSDAEPGKTRVLLARIGELSGKQGDTQQAITRLTEAIALDDAVDGTAATPRRRRERAGMQVNLGMALFNGGQAREGLRQLEEAFRYADVEPSARAIAGSMALQLQEFERSLQHFRRALELKPGWEAVQRDIELVTELSVLSDDVL